MIVVRIVLWPGGDKGREQELGSAVIANDGTGDEDIGHYDAVVKQPRRRPRGVRLHGFRRRRGPLHLLYEVLAAALGSP